MIAGWAGYLLGFPWKRQIRTGNGSGPGDDEAGVLPPNLESWW
jgi:hypothetical protein